MNLVQRTITSAYWSLFGNLTKLFILLLRSILLARWLSVETFGIYGLAMATIGVSMAITRFGMGQAFVHRAAETTNEDEAASVHFTLKLLFTGGWALILLMGSFLFAEGLSRTALIVLTLASGGVQLAETPQIILVRRVVHRRLALLEFLNALIPTLVALTLAWQGAELWALLSVDIASVLVTCLLLFGWRPVWRPHLSWSPPIVRYYLSFGGRMFVSGTLWMALDRIDDLWTGFYLGDAALGFYSQAYKFATFPRLLLGAPINRVVVGTFAELKEDRRNLSRLFFQTNALMVRVGYLLSGILFLLAPEFIRLVIGEKWLPMLAAFRLMLVFTLLDPLRKVLSHLYTAVGKPEQVIPSLIVRLIILIVGLYTLGPTLNIAGVALAVDAMLVVGMGLLLWQAKTYVDFSLKRLFAVPGIALAIGMLLVGAVLLIPATAGSDWRTAAIKLFVFSFAYVSILLLLERQEIKKMISLIPKNAWIRQRQ